MPNQISPELFISFIPGFWESDYIRLMKYLNIKHR